MIQWLNKSTQREKMEKGTSYYKVAGIFPYPNSFHQQIIKDEDNYPDVYCDKMSGEGMGRIRQFDYTDKV